jgi:hypothetical protein
MFMKQAFVTGVAAATVLVGFALAPANADFKEPVAPEVKQVGMITVVAGHSDEAVRTSPETPQDQVYDMTYGAASSATIVADALQSPAAEEPLVDYTFG